MNIKGILRDIYGLFVMAIILPIPILYGLGFLLGESIVAHLPNWFEWYYIVSAILLVCIAFMQIVSDKLKIWTKQSKNLNKKT